MAPFNYALVGLSFGPSWSGCANFRRCRSSRPLSSRRGIGKPGTIRRSEFGLATLSRDFEEDVGAGLQAAEGLGEAPERVKTLMALVDAKPVCVIVPSDREVSMKKLAAAFGGKSAQMMKPAEAERLSGYKVGGISPFGQMRTSKTAIEAQAMAYGGADCRCG